MKVRCKKTKHAALITNCIYEHCLKICSTWKLALRENLLCVKTCVAWKLVMREKICHDVQRSVASSFQCAFFYRHEECVFFRWLKLKPPWNVYYSFPIQIGALLPLTRLSRFCPGCKCNKRGCGRSHSGGRVPGDWQRQSHLRADGCWCHHWRLLRGIHQEHFVCPWFAQGNCHESRIKWVVSWMATKYQLSSSFEVMRLRYCFPVCATSAIDFRIVSFQRDSLVHLAPSYTRQILKLTVAFCTGLDLIRRTTCVGCSNVVDGMTFQCNTLGMGSDHIISRNI